jgi:AraC family transcriptional regulator of adaptative response / DNA-3-methyladenine glycosylase II
MELDRNACYRAVQARDPRFDGRFFTAVRTTGIYCRPICPARTPKFENVTFYRSPAAAQEAGYRPCLRCRPESSPDLDGWRSASSTVSRALELIAGGMLDGETNTVEGLAARLGIGERQLRRIFRDQLGVSPIAVAQTRRVLFAKQLLHETQMTMTDVALAAGFGSVRRFNDTFRGLYRRPPTALRHQRPAIDLNDDNGSGVTLQLSYAPPYDWTSILEFLAARAIPGIEVVGHDRYRRTIDLGGRHGTIEVAPARGRDALATTIRFPDPRALPTIVRRIRRVFDLGADVGVIAAQLGADPALAPLVRARPGLRVPGAWDGFELAVRAILGQQITVSGARRLIGRLVDAHAEPLRTVDGGDIPGLAAVFPRPERLAQSDLSLLGMPRARAAAVSGLAAATAADPELFDRDASLEAAVARLTTLPGVGDWTAQYVALRALREPDAFPAADVGLLRALTGSDGLRPTAAAVLARAEAWRPWRAYAAQHLWTSLAAGADAPPNVRETAVA